MVEGFAYSTFIQHQKPCVPANLNKHYQHYNHCRKKNTTNITPLSQKKTLPTLHLCHKQNTTNITPPSLRTWRLYLTARLFLISATPIRHLLTKKLHLFRLSIKNNPTKFLGEIAETRKATISFVISVCPSVRPLETTRQPLDGFS